MSQGPRYPTESRQTYAELMEHHSPEARGTKRDQVPLPEVARQVIREQIRSGPAAEAATVRHTRKRTARKEHPPPLPAAVGHISHQKALPAAPGPTSAALRPRAPTCQEMYNTWRALGEQVNNIARLPAFIKSSRLLCHRCRILKLQCTCYDYSQLESAYQAEDHRLRQAALRQIPASDALLLPGASGSPAVQYPLVPAARRDDGAGDGEAPVSPWSARRRQPTTPSPMRGPSASAAPAASASTFALAVTTPTPPPPRSQPPQPPQVAQLPVQPPRLVQFEIREVVIARERIGTNTRLWCCQYSTASPASSSSSLPPRVHLCAREDENLTTIRRHYSREHGSHRYHRQPALRTYCSSCGYVVSDGVAGVPHQCPSCGAADGRLWLRMLYALVEVPVPLSESGTDNSARTDGSNADAGEAATEDPYAVSAPPVMSLMVQPPAMPLSQLPTPVSPEAAFQYWMAYSMPPAVAYPLGPGGGGGGGGGGVGGGLLVDTNSNGGSMAPQTPMTPGFPSAATTTPATTTPGLYSSLAETDVFPEAWGLQPQNLAAEAQHVPQQQQQQQKQQPDTFPDGGDAGVYYQ